MTHFEQFIQYRALSFKFKTAGMSLGVFERLLANKSIGTNQDGTFVPAESLEEALPFKVQNVCAKLAQPLVDRRRDRKSTRLNSSHSRASRMPSSA